MALENPPQVSVILAVYNQAHYLSDAIDSVLNQSYKDYEIIAVDDGSTDSSLQLLHTYRERHPLNFRICANEERHNLGIVATYARGISAGMGRTLAFLEGDDLWDSNYLAEKVRILDRFPDVGVVFSPCRLLLDGYYGIDMFARQKVLQLFLPKERPFNNFEYLLRKNNVATFSAFAARADLVRSVPLPQDSRLCFYDWWLLTQLSFRTQFYFETRSRVSWRQSRGSLMGSQRFDDHKEQLTSFLEDLYNSVDRELLRQDVAGRERFTRMQRAKPHFVAFYRGPSARRFTEFFRVDPRWALETLASYVVNRSKFSASTGVARGTHAVEPENAGENSQFGADDPDRRARSK